MGQKLVTCCRTCRSTTLEKENLSEQIPLSLQLSSIEQNDSISYPSLCEIPIELFLYNIFPYLTFLDLYHLLQVNRFFYTLLQSTDDNNKELSAHLWSKCISDEMLDNWSDISTNDGQRETFESIKDKFQYLYIKRKQEIDPWTHVLSMRCGGCTGRSKTKYNWELYHRYITIYPTKSIRKEYEEDKLCIYYERGILNNTKKMDDHSRYLVTELEKPLIDSNYNEYRSYTYVGFIKCLQCKQKLILTPSSNEQQPKPYTWYISYLRKGSRHSYDKQGHRIEYIEIYCPVCERYSLWKCVAQPQNWFLAMGRSRK